MYDEKLVHALVLDMLGIDDETTDIIIKETRVMKSFQTRLVKKYRKQQIKENETMDALTYLFKNKFVVVIDPENGRPAKNIKSINMGSPNLVWRITEKGRKYYESIYNAVWID
jgi:hypothetical protein